MRMAHENGRTSSFHSGHRRTAPDALHVDSEALLLASDWDFLPHGASLGLACAQAWHKATTLYTHVVGKLCLRTGFQSPLSATSGATPCFSTITRFWRCSFLLSISSLFCFFVLYNLNLRILVETDANTERCCP